MNLDPNVRRGLLCHHRCIPDITLSKNCSPQLEHHDSLNTEFEHIVAPPIPGFMKPCPFTTAACYCKPLALLVLAAL